MTSPILCLLAALLATAVAGSVAANPCGGDIPCPLGTRSYRAMAPPGWDGTSPLPVLLHFHGWGRQGASALRNPRIVDPARASGMLLIAPDGLNKSWDFWSAASRDIEFAEAVIADAARRWPVDRNRIVVSGFSYGGAMAWRLACARGSTFTAYLAVAGGLRGQNAAACPGGPARVVHTHGLNDTVFGLPVAAGAAPEASMQLWRRINRTAEAPNRRWRHDGQDCREWQGRDGGADVTLCTHERGHRIPRGWFGHWLPQLLAAAPG